MCRIVLSCEGVPANVGRAGAADITEEFAHRPWHQNATCTWEADRLVLRAENDFDADGRVLRDEFSDALAACMEQGGDGEIKIESVTRF